MATPADKRRFIVAAATLAGIAAVLVICLVVLANVTRERIVHNQQAWIKEHLDALVAPTDYDNDPLTDTIEVTAPGLLGTTAPVTVYRMRKAGLPIAVAIRSIAPNGYRGPIELLVAIAPGGHLLGVRVIRHDETPGLGDAFENRDRGWLEKFRGLSLTNPAQQRWSLRRDGGHFDAFTGATITPRAIVAAVRGTLEFHQGNEDRLYQDGRPQ
jgi:electron transport complex protein RnfG